MFNCSIEKLIGYFYVVWLAIYVYIWVNRVIHEVAMSSPCLWASFHPLSSFLVVLYNMNGFRIETMYDYYIAMKSMFLIVKLSSHSFIGYASLTILLLWTTHKQHQNYSKPKAFQNQNNQFSQTLYSYHNFVQMKVFLKVTNTSLNTNQKETNQKNS